MTGKRKSSPSASPAWAIADIRQALLDHYDENKRALPWRKDRDPYRVWLSEIMLQQTRVDVVIPYYQKFLEQFPTLQALAQAREEQVLPLWSGLGYYSRCRRLHQAAQEIVEHHHSRFPSAPKDIRSLPGIGDYTAGAIASIAFQQREPAVDGNVVRVLARLLAYREDVSRPAARRFLTERTWQLVPPERPGDFNQALMELGATLCTPRKPTCTICPLSQHCLAKKTGQTEQIPETGKKTKSQAYFHLAAWVVNPAGQLLLVQRPKDEEILPGLWHPPGIFSQGDSASTAEKKLLLKQLQKLLGVPVKLGDEVARARHQITFRKIDARAHEVRLAKQPSKRPGLHWFDPKNSLPPNLACSSLLKKLLRSSAKPKQLDLLKEAVD